MRSRRRGVVAVVAVVAMCGSLAAACTGSVPPGSASTPDTSDTSPTIATTSIDIAGNEPFSSYNDQSSLGNHAANAEAIYLTNSAFNYYDADAKLVRNEAFGTYEIVSEEPFTVRYTVNDGVAWSDGTQIDAADLLLFWVANSGALNSDGFRPTRDDTGKIIDEAGHEVFFDGAIGNGLQHVVDVPEIGADGRSITMTYDQVFVDWELVFWSGVTPGLPAHVVAGHALGIQDPAQAKAAVITAIQQNDTVALDALADFWNTGFTFDSLPTDPSLYLSSGAYVISALVADQYMTLTRNPAYDWGPRPSIDSITIRYLTDPMAAVTALRNGEVDLIAPQPTADVRAAVEGLDGVEFESTLDVTYEHVDLQFTGARNEGVFDDRRVREAFLKTVPRREIVERLIQPLRPDAEVRNSLLLSPAFAGYDRMIAQNGSARFAEVDIAGARALLADAGVVAPEVCILYDSLNPRRVNQFQLIDASATQAGFDIVDCGSPSWGSLLEQAGTHDVGMFGWQSATTGVTASAVNFRTGGVNNYGGYSNPRVDALYDQLEVTVDPAKQLDLQIQIEQELWADDFGLPIYQFPGLTAWRDSVSGVRTAPLAPAMYWNFWQWEIS